MAIWPFSLVFLSRLVWRFSEFMWFLWGDVFFFFFFFFYVLYGDIFGIFLRNYLAHNSCVCEHTIVAFAFVNSHFVLLFSFSIFVFMRFRSNAATVYALFMNSSRKCWLFHGEQCTDALFMDPQISLSATFSLKMCSTALFTHLEIILLQCFQF